MPNYKIPDYEKIAKGWRRCEGCHGRLWNTETEATIIFQAPNGPILVEPCESHRPRKKENMQ
jgi:hypothetical protein